MIYHLYSLKNHHNLLKVLYFYFILINFFLEPDDYFISKYEVYDKVMMTEANNYAENIQEQLVVNNFNAILNNVNENDDLKKKILEDDETAQHLLEIQNLIQTQQQFINNNNHLNNNANNLLSIESFIHNNNEGIPDKINSTNVVEYNIHLKQICGVNNHNHHNKNYPSFKKFNNDPPPTEPVLSEFDNYDFINNDKTFPVYNDEVIHHNYSNIDFLSMINTHKREIDSILQLQTMKIGMLQKEINDLKYQVSRGVYLHSQDLQEMYELKKAKTNKIRKIPLKKTKDLPLPTSGKIISNKPDIVIKDETSKFTNPQIKQKPKQFIHHQDITVANGKKGSNKRKSESIEEGENKHINKKSKINY